METVLLQESLSSFNAVVDQLAQDIGYDNIPDKVVHIYFYIHVMISVFKIYVCFRRR